MAVTSAVIARRSASPTQIGRGGVVAAVRPCLGRRRRGMRHPRTAPREVEPWGQARQDRVRREALVGRDGPVGARVCAPPSKRMEVLVTPTRRAGAPTAARTPVAVA